MPFSITWTSLMWKFKLYWSLWHLITYLHDIILIHKSHPHPLHLSFTFKGYLSIRKGQSGIKLIFLLLWLSCALLAQESLKKRSYCLDNWRWPCQHLYPTILKADGTFTPYGIPNPRVSPYLVAQPGGGSTSTNWPKRV